MGLVVGWWLYFVFVVGYLGVNFIIKYFKGLFYGFFCVIYYNFLIKKNKGNFMFWVVYV